MTTIDLVTNEGAVCCPIGICGPEPDKVLIEFNKTLPATCLNNSAAPSSKVVTTWN